MKTHADEYVNYTPDLSVDRYCDDSITPFASEIEHVGLSALNDVLLAPAAIGLEVLYLDQSPGPEVNLHNFSRSEQFGFMTSSIRLLYRPCVLLSDQAVGLLTLSQWTLRHPLQARRHSTTTSRDLSPDLLPAVQRPRVRSTSRRLHDNGSRDVNDQSPTWLVDIVKL